MAIDKSLKQHYETQAGVKNYLGKQKMVKAPKYWLSKPGHVKAKLAYITDEEEQILIDKNLYGSLRGRPNKGPAGLPSLQGGDFGAGSGSSGGGGGGGGNGSHDRGGWQHHRAATRPTNIVTVTSTKTEPKDEPDGRSIALAKQYVEPVIVPKDEPIIRHHTVDTPIQKLEQKILDQLQEKEKEKFDADWEFEDKKIVKIPDIKPKIVETPERGVPWLEDELVKTVTPPKYSPTYYQDRSRIGGKTWGERAEEGMKRGFWDSGLGTLAKGVGTALAWPVASAFVPPKLMTGLTWGKRAHDFSKGKGTAAWLAKKAGFDPTKLTSNLTSNIEKARGRQFDPKDPIGWTGEQKRTKTFHKGEGGDKQQETTVQEAIAGKTSLGAEALGLPELQKRMAILHQLKQNEGFWNQLTDVQKRNINMAMMNYFKMIDQYSVKPNEGRIRNIG